MEIKCWQLHFGTLIITINKKISSLTSVSVCNFVDSDHYTSNV
jgi:hypothetical protein